MTSLFLDNHFLFFILWSLKDLNLSLNSCLGGIDLYGSWFAMKFGLQLTLLNFSKNPDMIS